jgi:hypothetical protein
MVRCLPLTRVEELVGMFARRSADEDVNQLRRFSCVSKSLASHFFERVVTESLQRGMAEPHAGGLAG